MPNTYPYDVLISIYLFHLMERSDVEFKSKEACLRWLCESSDYTPNTSYMFLCDTYHWMWGMCGDAEIAKEAASILCNKLQSQYERLE